MRPPSSFLPSGCLAVVTLAAIPLAGRAQEGLAPASAGIRAADQQIMAGKLPWQRQSAFMARLKWLRLHGNAVGSSGSDDFSLWDGFSQVSGFSDLWVDLLASRGKGPVSPDQVYPVLQAEPSGSLPSPQPQTFVAMSGSTAAGTSVAPQPQAPGETLFVDSTYTISAGDTTYAEVNVGNNANGVINHTGGTFRVTNQLSLGANTGQTGTYNLSGANAALFVNDLYIGGINGVGSGAFVQTNGTVTVTDGINLGSSNNVSDTYSISAGTLTTPYLVIGDLGPATFTQTGGSVTIASNVLQGFQFGGKAATYQLNGGTLTIPVVYSFTLNTGTFNFNGGVLQANAASTTFMQNLLAANVQAGGAKIDTNGFNLTVAQPLVTGGAGVADGGLTKQGGSGTLILSGANTYTGPTTINAGTLQAGVASVAGVSGAFGRNSAVTLGNVTGAALALNGFNTQIGSLTGGGTVGGNVTLGAATLTVGGDNTSPAAYAGVISGTGAITKIGTGALTLTGTNTYSGGTNVQAGRVVASNNGGAIPVGTVAISNGAVVELSNTSTTTNIYQVGNTFTGAGTLQKTGSGRLDFGGNTGTINVALSAGGLIDVQGGFLAGSNNYQANYGSNLGSLNIATGATFDGVEGTIRVDRLTGAGTLQGGYQAAGSTTVGVNNGSSTFSGVIQNSGASGGILALIKIGTGTQTLTGTSPYTGSTAVSGGTLAVNNNGTDAPGRLQGTGSIALNNGGTLLLGGSALVTDRLNNAASVTINGGGKLSTGGVSEGTAPLAANGVGGAVGVGALTLANTTSGARAIIDFGNMATGSALVFSSLAATGKGAFVTILGFTGLANTDGGAATNDRLLFVSNPGYTLTDLANWQFVNDAGNNFVTGGVQINYNGYYEIVPVPEPATWLGGALLVAGAGWVLRRRLCQKQSPSL